jgi:hypothetical protein
MDKYEDTVFDDGTEPTVRRIPKGCDQQGRYPQAADRDELGVQLPEKEPDWMQAAAVAVVAVTAAGMLGVLMLVIPAVGRMLHGS